MYPKENIIIILCVIILGLVIYLTINKNLGQFIKRKTNFAMPQCPEGQAFYSNIGCAEEPQSMGDCFRLAPGSLFQNLRQFSGSPNICTGQAGRQIYPRR